VFTYKVDGHVYLTVDIEGTATARAPEAEVDLELGRAGRDEVGGQIEAAWAAHAPKKSVTAYRAARTRWAKRTPITQDDIKRVVLELPGANYGPIWGKDLGFLIGTEKKNRFARFGPPAGGRVGNLLPPDDENSMVLFYCQQKPDLLAASADRYFTTPHYGSIDEPGGVIVRLSEHRGADDLAELAELIEDAWREVASPEMIEQRDRER